MGLRKKYDAKKAIDYIEEFSVSNSQYAKKRDCLGGCFDSYTNNDTYRGTAAEDSKKFIGIGERRLLNETYELNNELLRLYIHAQDSFSTNVDSAPDAKIDTDVLEIIQKDFCNYFNVMDVHGRNIENKASELAGKYGKYGYITCPDYGRAKNVFEEFCGGDDLRSGYLNECAEKLENFDIEECDYVDETGISERIEDCRKRLQLTNGVLNSLKLVSFEIESVDISIKKVLKYLCQTEAGNWLLFMAKRNNGKLHKGSKEGNQQRTVQMYMDMYGYTREEAMLLYKAIGELENAAVAFEDSDEGQTAFVYGTLSALCINYDAKRWRMTTGQPNKETALKYLRLAGLSEKEILDLQVIINLQHGDFTYEQLKKNGIDVYNSTFYGETNTSIVSRAKDKNIDFAHQIVQITAFAYGDSIYEHRKVGIPRWMIDLFNSHASYEFNETMTFYEISFKGDIDSGRYSEADFQSDVDAINIYKRMRKEGYYGQEEWADYYQDISNDSKNRAIEFFENMGDGDIDVGIINTANVIEAETYGSDYIQLTNNTDVDTAKRTFMQWIMSIYEGVEYDFPE